MAKIIEIRDGAAVQFPFELKDIFRKAFPSAKWNSGHRRWEVGPRSIKRLAAWVAEIEKSGVEAEIASRDEQDLTDEEIRKLAFEIKRISNQVQEEKKAQEAQERALERLQDLRAQLDATNAELEEAKAASAAAKKAADVVRADIDARVAHITTRDYISAVRRAMLRDWSVLKSANRHRFEERQSELAKIERELNSAGVHCEALSKALEANFNRPDRDLSNLYREIEFSIAE